MNQPIIIERKLSAPIEKVWKALTHKEQISKWLFTVNDFECRVGFEFRFIGGKDDISYLHVCKITEVIPLKKLSFTWRYDGFSGNSFVTFELSAGENNQTLLRLIHEGLETLPVSNPTFLNGHYLPDWTSHIQLMQNNFNISN